MPPQLAERQGVAGAGLEWAALCGNRDVTGAVLREIVNYAKQVSCDWLMLSILSSDWLMRAAAAGEVRGAGRADDLPRAVDPGLGHGHRRLQAQEEADTELLPAGYQQNVWTVVRTEIKCQSYPVFTMHSKNNISTVLLTN